ncbi:hypothetical protein LF41_61 [Lysobacter dokdonensis DS-58]|uniref:Secreted protein n=2 Tax=Noviluteimonas TaxID=3382693 RepID=A0A0A2X6H6_9GAMM|nr:hypothetical protein LF41_61 [Lysobacter dokdonensis DS-58]
MHHPFALTIALAVAVAPFEAQAQVANGTFASGFASWTVGDAVFAQGGGTDCSSAPYTATTKNTSKKGTAPASGTVAQATPFISYAPGAWTLCRQLEQMVYVPVGKQLKFSAKLGEGIYASQYQIEPVGLSVHVIDNGQATMLFSQAGHNIVCGNGEFPCPIYRAQTLDMSPYWGKTVRLVIRGNTGVRNGQTGGISEPSYAFVDDVRLE